MLANFWGLMLSHQGSTDMHQGSSDMQQKVKYGL